VKRGWRAAAIGMVLWVSMLGVYELRPRFVERLELVLLDAHFRLRGATAPQHPIAIVAIDEASIDAVGRWPWTRTIVADLIDRLTELGVSAVALDVIFSEPETVPDAALLDRVRAELLGIDGAGERIDAVAARLDDSAPDRVLERAIERSERTLLGMFFRTDAGDVPSPDALDTALAAARRAQYKLASLPPGADAEVLPCTGVETVLPSFANAAQRMGFVNAARDLDGSVRRVPLAVACGANKYLPLSLAMAERAWGMGTQIRLVRDPRAPAERPRPGVLVQRPSAPGQPKAEALWLAADAGARALVNFRGPRGTFPTYSAVDVLRGRVPDSALRDRFVFVGITAVAVGDDVATPFGEVFPGVEVHANALDNYLSNDLIATLEPLRVPWIGLRVDLQHLTIVAVGLLLSLVVPGLRRIGYGFAIALSLAALVLASSVYAFAAHGLWIPMTYVMLTLIVVYAGVGVTHGIAVESHGRMIRRQFTAVIPPALVREIEVHPERFKLGMRRADLSMLFSDIRDFTSISEDIGPEEVGNMLNVYLTPMAEIIRDTGGTLDKYIGDAVVAFWNAPGAVEQYPARACEAALRMQTVIARLRAERASDVPGIDRLRVGIGIHSEEVVVGFMGSTERVAYTVAGDGVNLCARLEGLTKLYGVGILASEQLVSRLPEGFAARKLDMVSVKGRETPVTIYEVVGRDPAILRQPWMEKYAAAQRLYEAGTWPEATTLFREILTERVADGPSSLLLERMRTLGDPPPGWNGVYTFTMK
jgi:adenylate cyclase